MFAYKANVMVEEDQDGMVWIERDVYLRVAFVDRVVVFIMQFVECAWPWSGGQPEKKPNCDPHTVKSGRGVLFPLLLGMIDRVRRVGVHSIELGTRNSLIRALAMVLCSGAINWNRFYVVGCYPYETSLKDVYSVQARRSKQERTC